MSTLEKPTPPQTETGQLPAEQAGNFLDGELSELTVHSRITLFNPQGEFIAQAIPDIQKLVQALGKQPCREVIQRYYGFEPHRTEVDVKDEKGKPTGDKKWVDVHKPGLTGVECVIYLRPAE